MTNNVIPLNYEISFNYVIDESESDSGSKFEFSGSDLVSFAI